MPGNTTNPLVRGITLLGLCALPLHAATVRADVLDQIRDEVRSPDEPKPKEEKKEKKRGRSGWSCDIFADDCRDDDHTSSTFGAAVGAALLFTATSPFWVPVRLLDDQYRPGFFPRYPYEDDRPGYLTFYPEEGDEVYPFATILSLEYADDYDDFKRIGGNLVFDTSTRFGIDTEAHYREESLSGNRHDSLWTGDFNIVYRFAQSENVQMRSGLGFNWLDDDIDTEFGFNFTYGADFMLGRPLIASAVLDLGKLGDATLFHCRATLGAQWHGVEVYTGYDYYAVDSAHINGMIGGLRFWF